MLKEETQLMLQTIILMYNDISRKNVKCNLYLKKNISKLFLLLNPHVGMNNKIVLSIVHWKCRYVVILYPTLCHNRSKHEQRPQ